MLDCNLVKKLFYVIQCFCNKSLWLDPSSVLHQVSGFKVKIFGFSSLNILWCWNIFVSNKKTFLHGKVLVNLMSNCHSPLHAYQFTLIELIGSVGARAKLLSEIITKARGGETIFFIVLVICKTKTTTITTITSWRGNWLFLTLTWG